MSTFEQDVARAASDAGISEPPAPETPPEEVSTPATEPPAEAPPEDPAEPPVEGKPAPQTVPLAVHIRQREKHDREARELRQQVANLGQQFAQGEQRLAELWKGQQPPEEPPPDPKTDILGAMHHEQTQLKNQLGALTQQLGTRAAEEQTRKQVDAVQQAVAADEAAFSREHPDFKDAFDYVKRAKYQEYTVLGLPETQASARVQQDCFALALHALQQGLSPSELAYRLAEVQGYKRKAAANGNGKPVAGTAEAAVEMRAAGAARAHTGGAGENAGQLTFADLAQMSNDEFSRVTAGKNWVKIAGGG